MIRKKTKINLKYRKIYNKCFKSKIKYHYKKAFLIEKSKKDLQMK